MFLKFKSDSRFSAYILLLLISSNARQKTERFQTTRTIDARAHELRLEKMKTNAVTDKNRFPVKLVIG